MKFLSEFEFYFLLLAIGIFGTFCNSWFNPYAFIIGYSVSAIIVGLIKTFKKK